MKDSNEPPTVKKTEVLTQLEPILVQTDTDNLDALFNSVLKFDILIFCDDDTCINFYKENLKPTYNVVFAKTIQQLKRNLNSLNNINLVLLDKKNFQDALAVIKNNPIYHSVPVIVCTESEDETDISNILSNDVFDVWRKPFKLNLLLFRIYKIISLHSSFDMKTGLLCQEAFISRAEKILKHNPSKTFYLIRYDIDNFKIYNYTYGISEGDKLLQYIGQKSNSLATDESIFCRWEKDHFVALIEERYLSTKNIIRYFTQLEQYFHKDYKLSIRMGLYKIVNPSMPIVQMCDKALMAHKSSKMNVSSLYGFYDSRVLEEQIEEQKITEEMEKALNEEQFIVYLQPQYNQATMQLYGAEALVRWNHPERGLINPSYFIPIFERNGFISKLDRYIFRKVCELQRKWLDEGLNIVPISVNLSRTEAVNEHLCDELLKILTEFHLTTKYINLEITESAYMDNPYQVVNLTKRLQEAGFELEMDDFGSGYSSLNTLKEIPVDVLKLDLKFLYGKDDSNRTTKILSSIIRMAHGMSMPIIAEGVETEEQAHFLKSLGCFYIQGFYFDKPMPTTLFENRLKNFLPDTVKKNRFSTEIANPNKIDIPTLLNDFIGPAGIIEYDEHKIEGTRCNNPFYTFFDFSPEDYSNYQLELKENFEAADYNILINTLKRSSSTKEICDCELRLLPKENRNRPTWIRLKSSFLYKNNHISTFLVRVEDIDNEVANATRINDVTDDIYALSDSLPGGAIKVKFCNGKFSNMYANEGLATMLGISLTQYLEATKDDILYFVHPEDKQLLHDELMNAIESKDSYLEQPYRLVDKHGKNINVHVYCKITHKPDGTIFGVAAILNTNEKTQYTKYIAQLEKENRTLKTRLALERIDENLIIKDANNLSIAKKRKLDITDSLLQTDRSVEYQLAEEFGRFATFKYSLLKNKFIDMSESLPRLFGYTRAEFYQKFNDSMSNFVWKDDNKQTWEKFQNQILQNEISVCVEHRVQTKNGELKWVRGRAKKVVEDNGNEYFAGTIIDIDIERGLYKTIDSQKFTIDTLENNIEGATLRFKISGSKWAIDFISQKNEALIGCSLKKLFEIWKDNPYHFAHPDDIENIKKATMSSIENEDSHKINFRIIKADGVVRWITSIGKYYPLTKDEGYLVLTCYDITDRLLAETQVLDEKQKLQNLIDALPGGIASYEIRPNKLHVQYVSSKVAQMFGKTKEEFIYAVEEDQDIGVFSKDYPRVVQAIRQLELTGKPFHVNFRVQHKDGYLVWATVNAVKTGNNRGNPTFVAVYQNKTKHTDTLDQILSKTAFFVIVFDAETKEMLYANPQAEILANKCFNEFEPINVSEFLFDSKVADLDTSIPSEFESDEYKTIREGKNLLVKRFRIDWNGHDAIFVLAEEIFI